jgi:hypothetical protein
LNQQQIVPLIKIRERKKPLLIALVTVICAGCTKTVIVTNPKALPPGQAKKAVGAKSASSFTPAAQKKVPQRQRKR